MEINRNLNEKKNVIMVKSTSILLFLRQTKQIAQ